MKMLTWNKRIASGIKAFVIAVAAIATTFALILIVNPTSAPQDAVAAGSGSVNALTNASGDIQTQYAQQNGGKQKWLKVSNWTAQWLQPLDSPSNPHSTYWTDLGETVQNDIINRTEHTF